MGDKRGDETGFYDAGCLWNTGFGGINLEFQVSNLILPSRCTQQTNFEMYRACMALSTRYEADSCSSW